MLFVLNVEAIESGTTASAVPLLSLSSMTVSLSSYTHTHTTYTDTYTPGGMFGLHFRGSVVSGDLQNRQPFKTVRLLHSPMGRYGIRYPNISFHNRFDQDFGV